MPSRQTIHNRTTDAARLRVQLVAAGVDARVQYDDARGRYVVTRSDDVELVAGRYEVVYGYLRGYLDGASARAGEPLVVRELLVQLDTIPRQMTVDREHGYDHLVWLSAVKAALLDAAP